MKRSPALQVLIFGFALILAATACKKTDKGTTAIPGSRPGVTGDNRNDLLNSGLTTSNDSPKVNEHGNIPLTGNRNIDDPNRRHDADHFQSSTVYFALDSSTVRANERGKLNEIVSYLKANPNADVLIEGHCDERGTEGYNLALGDRRALAVREALVALGAPADNLHTVSFGEAKPAVQGHSEAAWSKNRRAAFVLVLPAQ